MTLQIREATMDDVTDLSALTFHAFCPGNPIERNIFPKGLTPSVFEISRADMTKALNAPFSKHMVISYTAPLPEGQENASSETQAGSTSMNNRGCIIAYSKWRFYTEGVPQTKENQPLVLEEFDLGPVEEVNYDLAKEFFAKLRQHRLEGIGIPKYAYLSMLATHPSYRGLGAGSKLLDWGVKEAERRDLECWLQASPSGLPLYRRRGFEDVSSFSIDVQRYTDKEDPPYVTVLMRRRLKAKHYGPVME